LGNQIAIDVWRGLALLHPDLITEAALWGTESSFTEEGALAGEIVPQQTGPLNFRGFGTQTSGGTVSLQVQAPGFAGITNRLAVIRKDQGSTNWGGWDPPATIQQTSAPSWNGSNSITSTYPCMAADAEGRVVVVYWENNGGASYKIRSRALDPDTGVWGSAVDVHSYGTSAPLYDGRACVHRAKDNAFICTVVIYDDTRSTANLRVYRSADQGATWNTVSSFALDEPLDGRPATSGAATFQNPGRIRTCESGGQVLCLLEVEITLAGYAKGTQTLQFCSTDGGLTYRTVVSALYVVTTLADTVHRCRMDIAATREGFAVAYIEGVPGTDVVRVAKLANGFIRHSDAPYIEVINTEFVTIGDGGSPIAYVDDGDLAWWRDDAGAYFLILTALDKTGDPSVIYRSRDNLDTFEGIGSSDRVTVADPEPTGSVFDTATATTRPDRFHAIPHRGGALWATNCKSSGAVDNDLFVHRLGGWSSVVMPAINLSNFDRSRATWLRTGIPYDLPDAAGWVLTTTGGSSTLASGPRVTVATTSQQRLYGITPQSTNAEGYIAHFAARVNSGGSIANEEVGIKLLLSGGSTTEYECTIRLSTTHARLMDDVAPAALGSAAIDLTADFYEFRISLVTGKVKAWYRIHDFMDDQEWTELGSSTTISARTLGSAGTNAIRFGHLLATTSNSDWKIWNYTSDEYTGDQMATQSNPGDLIGRPVGSSDRPIYTIDGLSVSAIGGPGREGDQFISYASASFPWWRVLPMVSASPRVPFRTPTVSSGAVAAQKFAFVLQDNLTTSGQESRWPTDVLIVDVRNTNARDILIEGYASGAWSTLADTNTVIAQGQIGRDGKTVRYTGAGASASNRYIAPDALAGGTVKLSGTPVLRRIEGNESGFMQPAAATKQAIVRIADALTADPTSYVSGEIWSPHATIVIPLKGQDLAAVAVSLKSQQTADNYLEVGTIGIYYGVALREYSYGWSHTHEPNAAIEEQTSGTRRGVELGPARRVTELAWIDPVNTSPIEGDGASPDFYKATDNAGGLAIAAPAETAERIAGAVRQMGGGAQLSLLLPRVDHVASGGTDVQVYRLPGDVVYGRVTNAIRLEHVTGEEGNGSADSFIGPVVRVARLIHEEEV
jgi:hypothetical protein